LAERGKSYTPTVGWLEDNFHFLGDLSL